MAKEQRELLRSLPKVDELLKEDIFQRHLPVMDPKYLVEIITSHLGVKNSNEFS